MSKEWVNRMEQGTVLRLVLDGGPVTDPDRGDGLRIWVRAVLPDDDTPLPFVLPGCTRNVVRVFYDVPLNIPVFVLFAATSRKEAGA